MMRSWLRRRSAGAPLPAARGRVRPRLEVLEDRTVPTAVAAPSNLVSWWTANNTAADAMGLNNASLSNVTYSAGKVGNDLCMHAMGDTTRMPGLVDPAKLAAFVDPLPIPPVLRPESGKLLTVPIRRN